MKCGKNWSGVLGVGWPFYMSLSLTGSKLPSCVIFYSVTLPEIVPSIHRDGCNTGNSENRVLLWKECLQIFILISLGSVVKCVLSQLRRETSYQSRHSQRWGMDHLPFYPLLRPFLPDRPIWIPWRSNGKFFFTTLESQFSLCKIGPNIDHTCPKVNGHRHRPQTGPRFHTGRQSRPSVMVAFELDNHILTVGFVLLALWLYKMYHKERGRLFSG